MPTGYEVRQTPVSSIEDDRQDLAKINDSLLVPWQKLNAMTTFILPLLDFLMSLPQRASAEVVFLPPNKGGGGLLPLSDMVDLLTVAHAFKILTCKYATVSELAMSSLRVATSIRMKKAASGVDCARFLSRSLDDDMMVGAQTDSFWSRSRNAARKQIT